MQEFRVIGAPILHSRSPQIHRLFAAQTRMADGSAIVLNYQAELVQPEQLQDFLTQFWRAGGQGVNLTLPLKHSALGLCTSLDRYAQRAAAVNTLVRSDSGWHGANTDGLGLMRDLQQRHGVALAGSRVAILGAGGAVRGILQPLLEALAAPSGAQRRAPPEVVIFNRSVEKAEQLCAEFGANAAIALRARPLTGLADQHWNARRDGDFDLLIHASSSGHSPQTQFALPDWPAALVADHGVVYDLSYGVAARATLAWSAEREVQGFDGLGMLIEQAAEAFALWYGVRPQTAPVWAALRAEC